MIRHQTAARPAIAAAELALVLPVLVIVIMGCIDFGRFSDVSITVTNAARTGAEFGSTHLSTAATFSLWEHQVRQAVVDEMARMKGYKAERLAVKVTLVIVGDHTRVEVEVSHPFETVGHWPGLPQQVIIRRVVSMPTTRP
jgi:Flp pilus assembly protein TadG